MGTCCSSPAVQVEASSTKDKTTTGVHALPATTNTKTGAEGLKELGFEFRLVACDKHRDSCESGNHGTPPTTATTSHRTESTTTPTTTTTSTTNSHSIQRSFRRIHHNDDDDDDDSVAENKNYDNNDSNIDLPTSCPNPASCLDCITRLFRINDNTMVTSDNRKTIIPGRMYNKVNEITHQMVIKWLEQEFGMQRKDLFCDPDTGEAVEALVSRLQDGNDHNNKETAETAPTLSQQTLPATLLVVTGRGFCRAGILSTRHTIESGVEVGSAMHPIVMALERKMEVVILDPNARGNIQGLDTLFRSLDSRVLAPYLQHRPIYILAHSAAGGYLVQYLLQQPATAATTTTTETNSSSQEPSSKPLLQPTTARNIKLKTPLITLKPPFYVTLPQIQAMVFTDSTHHLEWLSLQDRPDVTAFLQSPTCLYIRNTQDDFFAPCARNKQAGDPMINPSVAWIKRFGTIPTVYAGTPDHSLMCYTARHVIWNFMDQQRHLFGQDVVLEPKAEQKDDKGEDNAEEATQQQRHSAGEEQETAQEQHPDIYEESAAAILKQEPCSTEAEEEVCQEQHPQKYEQEGDDLLQKQQQPPPNDTTKQVEYRA